MYIVLGYLSIVVCTDYFFFLSCLFQIIAYNKNTGTVCRKNVKIQPMFFNLYIDPFSQFHTPRSLPMRVNPYFYNTTRDLQVQGLYFLLLGNCVLTTLHISQCVLLCQEPLSSYQLELLCACYSERLRT